jgi:type IV pilus assembly protein PilW
MITISIRKHTNISPRYQGGLSLIELMISLTIGLLLLTGITSLIVQQSNTRGELEKASRQIENGRYAMQLLHDDIQLAGFYSEYSPASGVTYTVPTDPCDIATGGGDSGWSTTPTVPVPIYGFPGALTDPTTATTCGLTNYKPYTAILVVRRTASAAVNPAGPLAGTYLQVSQCSTAATPFVLGTGGFSLLQKDCLTPANIRPYIVDIYYISTCSVCGTDTIPTLKMVQAGPNAAPSAPIPLVEGIDNMQFDYGIDNSGDGAPDSYTPTPVAANWQNIMAVQVNLLARNNDPTPGYQDSRTYRLSVVSGVAVAGPFPDPFKRHAYSEFVRAINPSGRRE